MGNFRMWGLLLALISAFVPSSSAQYSERVEVSTANVDVVVTDAEGNVVSGLTRDDFELFENGRRQPITNFAAYGLRLEEEPAAELALPEPAPTAVTGVRPRLIILFLDINDVSANAKKQFFDGVLSFLDVTMHDSDEVSVLSWGNRVRTLLPPGADRAAADALLRTFARSARSTVAITREIGDRAIDDAVVQQDLAEAGVLGAAATSPEEEAEFREWILGEERCAASIRKVKELSTALVSLARIDAQKIVLIASDDFPLTAAKGCPLAGAVGDLALVANTYGITIHGLHPSGVREKSVAAEQTLVPQRAYQPPRTQLTGQTAQRFTETEMSRMFAEAGGLSWAAEQTGGHTAAGPLHSAEVLERIAQEAESYYSLGYRLAGTDERPRNLKVTTRDRSYRVRVRKNVVKLSERRRVSDLVTQHLYLQPVHAPATSPRFSAKVNSVKRDGRFVVIDVLVAVPHSELRFGGEAVARRASYSVFVAAGREMGDASDVTEVRYEIAAPERPGMAAGSLIPVKIRPDSRRISIAVRDNTTGEAAVQVIDLPRNLLQARSGARSKAKAIKNAIRVAANFAQNSIDEKIRERIRDLHSREAAKGI